MPRLSFLLLAGCAGFDANLSIESGGAGAGERHGSLGTSHLLLTPSLSNETHHLGQTAVWIEVWGGGCAGLYGYPTDSIAAGHPMPETFLLNCESAWGPIGSGIAERDGVLLYGSQVFEGTTLPDGTRAWTEGANLTMDPSLSGPRNPVIIDSNHVGFSADGALHLFRRADAHANWAEVDVLPVGTGLVHYDDGVLAAGSHVFELDADGSWVMDEIDGHVLAVRDGRVLTRATEHWTVHAQDALVARIDRSDADAITLGFDALLWTDGNTLEVRDLEGRLLNDAEIGFDAIHHATGFDVQTNGYSVLMSNHREIHWVDMTPAREAFDFQEAFSIKATGVVHRREFIDVVRVPADTARLVVETEGYGDAELHLTEHLPDPDYAVCSSAISGAHQSCVLENPRAGAYFIVITTSDEAHGVATAWITTNE